VAVAAIVAAWLALSLRAVEFAGDGAAVLERGQVGAGLGRPGGISRAEAEHGLELLRRAQDYNADSQPLLDEISLLLVMGRERAADAAARRAVADEPDNPAAWTLLFVASRLVGDRETATRAARQIRLLNPLFARTLSPPSKRGS
jgi:hypothetical protein